MWSFASSTNIHWSGDLDVVRDLVAPEVMCVLHHPVLEFPDGVRRVLVGTDESKQDA